MKVTKFPKFLSKKYLRLAATYRRCAGRDKHFDFSLASLIECFIHESKGLPASKNNGYVFGKWNKDITISTWKEDIRAGLFAKFEFYTPLNKWWAEPALKNVIVHTKWFPYDLNEQLSIVKINDLFYEK
jgi:hypothetical protein